MVGSRKQQNENEAAGPAAEAAQGAAAAQRTQARAAGDAPHRAETAGVHTADQGGQAASEALGSIGSAGSQAVFQISDIAADAARRRAQLALEAQHRFVEDMAERLKETGQTMAQAARQAADDARVLMPRLASEAGGLHEVQRALTGAWAGMTCTSLRLTREVLRLSSPSTLIDLQLQFARECLGALVEGQAIVLRAVRSNAAEALRPIEQRLEQRGRQGAGQGGQQGNRVADVMSRGARVAKPDDTVQQAARVMREEDTGVLPVGENDRLVGLVTDRDVALRLAAEGKDPARTKVREVMTPEVRYVFEDEDVHRAVETMAGQQVRRLPVLDRDKRLVGIVSLGDLATSEAHVSRGAPLAGVAQAGGQHDQAAE
jgi:CBS domain-containing protein